MGTNESKPAPLITAFERINTWSFKQTKKLLQDYKDKDLDFGLDVQMLADLLHGDKGWAEKVIAAFQSTNGIINALAFICGVALVTNGTPTEKAELVFDALDFDSTEQISMDEMTIVFLCCARGFTVLSGQGTVPPDEELETITLQAYRELNKSSSQSIAKKEFVKWVLKFLGDESDFLSLAVMMNRFGLSKLSPLQPEEAPPPPPPSQQSDEPVQDALSSTSPSSPPELQHQKQAGQEALKDPSESKPSEDHSETRQPQPTVDVPTESPQSGADTTAVSKPSEHMEDTSHSNDSTLGPSTSSGSGDGASTSQLESNSEYTGQKAPGTSTSPPDTSVSSQPSSSSETIPVDPVPSDPVAPVSTSQSTPAPDAVPALTEAKEAAPATTEAKQAAAAPTQGQELAPESSSSPAVTSVEQTQASPAEQTPSKAEAESPIAPTQENSKHVASSSSDEKPKPTSTVNEPFEAPAKLEPPAQQELGQDVLLMDSYDQATLENVTMQGLPPPEDPDLLR